MMSNGGRDKGRCVSIFILVNFLNNYGTSMQPDIYKSKIICDSFFFFLMSCEKCYLNVICIAHGEIPNTLGSLIM